jgi:hypothetical protein
MVPAPRASPHGGSIRGLEILDRGGEDAPITPLVAKQQHRGHEHRPVADKYHRQPAAGPNAGRHH